MSFVPPRCESCSSPLIGACFHTTDDADVCCPNCPDCECKEHANRVLRIVVNAGVPMPLLVEWGWVSPPPPKKEAPVCVAD